MGTGMATAEPQCPLGTVGTDGLPETPNRRARTLHDTLPKERYSLQALVLMGGSGVWDAGFCQPSFNARSFPVLPSLVGSAL